MTPKPWTRVFTGSTRKAATYSSADQNADDDIQTVAATSNLKAEKSDRRNPKITAADLRRTYLYAVLTEPPSGETQWAVI
jgi:ABC-type cobalt transport system substrate-binding protein